MTGRHDVLVRVLRVFTDDGGRQGNALGVIDGALVGQDDRQRVAHELGFSETIFIDDRDTGELARVPPPIPRATPAGVEPHAKALRR